MHSRAFLPSATLALASFGTGLAALILGSRPLGGVAMLLAVLTLAILAVSSRRSAAESRASARARQTTAEAAPLARPTAPAEERADYEPPPAGGEEPQVVIAEDTEPAATEEPRPAPAADEPQPEPALPADEPEAALEPAAEGAPHAAAAACAAVYAEVTTVETTLELPAAPDAPASPLSRIRFPASLGCDAVLKSLLEAARMAGDARATHVWLADHGTATLRLVASAGERAPSGDPLPADDVPLGRAARGGRAEIEYLPAASGGDAVWRYALPLGTNGIRGVAGVDFVGSEAPDMEVLSVISPAMRGALAGCLALSVAKTQARAAETLLDTARDLARLLRPEDVLEAAVDRALALSDGVTVSIMLLDENRHMRIAASRGLPPEIVAETNVAEGEGIAGWVLTTGQPMLVEDLPNRNRPARRHGVRASLSVPLADEDGVLGVLNVGSRRLPAWFSASHISALETLARQVTVALRNATAVESATDVYFDTLRALALAVETKDPYASGGTDRVLELAVRIARAMGVHGDELRAVEIASLLHDIGMSAAGETVTVAHRPLSTVEKGLLKMHPVIAAEVLEQAPALKQVVPIVYHHHEWYDGHGYVTGISGETIPLGARILAVADAYVAMTSERPYRRAMTHEEALQELAEGVGTQFDPAVVEAAEQALAHEGAQAPSGESRF